MVKQISWLFWWFINKVKAFGDENFPTKPYILNVSNKRVVTKLFK